jgi:hypothetical protein
VSGCGGNHLVQDTVQCLAVVNVVVKFWVLKKVGFTN